MQTLTILALGALLASASGFPKHKRQATNNNNMLQNFGTNFGAFPSMPSGLDQYTGSFPVPGNNQAASSGSSASKRQASNNNNMLEGISSNFGSFPTMPSGFDQYTGSFPIPGNNQAASSSSSPAKRQASNNNNMLENFGGNFGSFPTMPSGFDQYTGGIDQYTGSFPIPGNNQAASSSSSASKRQASNNNNMLEGISSNFGSFPTMPSGFDQYTGSFPIPGNNQAASSSSSPAKRQASNNNNMLEGISSNFGSFPTMPSGFDQYTGSFPIPGNNQAASSSSSPAKRQASNNNNMLEGISSNFGSFPTMPSGFDQYTGSFPIPGNNQAASSSSSPAKRQASNNNNMLEGISSNFGSFPTMPSGFDQYTGSFPIPGNNQAASSSSSPAKRQASNNNNMLENIGGNFGSFPTMPSGFDQYTGGIDQYTGSFPIPGNNQAASSSSSASKRQASNNNNMLEGISNNFGSFPTMPSGFDQYTGGIDQYTGSFPIPGNNQAASSSSSASKRQASNNNNMLENFGGNFGSFPTMPSGFDQYTGGIDQYTGSFPIPGNNQAASSSSSASKRQATNNNNNNMLENFSNFGSFPTMPSGFDQYTGSFPIPGNNQAASSSSSPSKRQASNNNNMLEGISSNFGSFPTMPSGFDQYTGSFPIPGNNQAASSSSSASKRQATNNNNNNMLENFSNFGSFPTMPSGFDQYTGSFPIPGNQAASSSSSSS